MSKRIMLITVVLTMVVSLACISAGADNVTINTSGTTPFLYEGHSYLPLKSVASFLDAPLRWDAAKGQAVITYNGQDLALTPGNANALFKGQPVVLPSPLGVLVERGGFKTSRLVGNLSGRKVFTEDGKNLGTVHEYDVDTKNGKITCITVL